jgi:hypothetical protein
MTFCKRRPGAVAVAWLCLAVLLITGCGKSTLDRIVVVPEMARLTVGQTLQLQATGLDTKGKPMKDVPFTWAVDGTHGRIDAKGLFTAMAPGQVTVTVSSGAVSHTAVVTVERETVASLVPTGTPAELTVGEPVTLSVMAKNAAGQGIAEAPVQAQPLSPDTVVEPTTATTDANGQATFTITMAPQVSANQVQFSADAQQATVVIQGRAGAPAELHLTPSSSSAVAGEDIQLQARVQDKAGNPVPGVEVQFSPRSAETSSTPSTGVTDAQGVASAVIKTSPTAGGNRVQVAVTGLSAQDIEIQGRAGAPARVTLQADSTDTVAGGIVTLSLLVQDQHGNAVATVPVDLSATPEGAALEGKAVTTDASGGAQVRLQTSTAAGPNTVQAHVANLPDAHLTVTGHAPTTLSIAPQTATIDMLGTQRFVATIADASGHTTVIMPTWKVIGEAGSMAADGTFTAKKLGSDALVATYADLTAGAQLTVVPGAVAALRLSPSVATVISGATQQFRVEAFNAHQHALEITPTWSVRNAIGTIDTSGLFTAGKAGEGAVVVTADGVSASARLTVQAGELATISITPERVSLKAGEELQLQAQGRDAAGNTVPIEPLWALAVNLGELDPTTGMFRALHTGTGQIRVEAGPRPTVTEIPVEVSPAALDKVEVHPPTLTLSAGEEFAFTATGYDAFGNAIAITPVWELTADLGTLTPAGELKAQRTGAAVVRATVGQFSGQASVIIKPGTLTALTIDPAGPVVLSAGESIALTISGQDAFGNVIALTPTWSQSETLGTLGVDGLFRAEKVGTTDIIAQSHDLRASVQVSITPGKLAKIALTPPTTTILAGETLPFKATGLDAYNNEVPIQPTWRVTDDIGDITDAGKFKALQAVSGQIIATAEGISSTAQVTVQPGPLTLLKVTPETLALTAGDSAEIIVVGYDAFGNPVPAEPVWHITEGMGVVNDTGLFTAQKAGDGRIVVVVGHLAAIVSLRVTKGEAAALRIAPAQSHVASGKQQQFTAEGLDRGGNQVPVDVAWAVQGNIGTIDPASGLFSATMAESGSVIARAGSLTASAQVLVEPGEVTSLRLTPQSASLIAGETLALQSEAFDAAGNRSPTSPTWSVTEDLGTVSEDAVFQARRAGTGQIIARIGNAQQAISIQIKAGALATITLDPATITVKAGSRHDFAAAGSDAFGNPVPVEPTWSLQGNIGKIDPAQGTFEATAAGAGTVVAVMGHVAGLAPVTVEAGTASRLQVRPRRLTLAAGEKGRFMATAFDQLGNPTTGDIVWELTAPLGEISAGEFQARQAGSAEVVARLGDIEARANVEVQPGAVARLQVIPRSLELASGSTLQFRALGYDAYDNMQEVAATWSLSGDIGDMSPNGVLTAGPQGQGRVTAHFAELSNQVEVTVVPGPVQQLLLSPRRAELPATSSQRFTAIGLDAGGNQRDVTVRWAVTQGLGNLDQTGQLTAMHVGAGTVVAYTPGALVGTSDVRIAPGPVALLFVSPQPLTLRAGQSTQFLVQGFDAYRNPIPTLAPQWAVDGNIGAIDAHSGVFTAQQMGWGKVTAVVQNTLGKADVVVEPGMPDAEHSRLVSSRVTVPADGKTTANIVVLVRDQFGNAVTGARVTLISSRQDRVEQPGPSNEQGIAIGRIHSTVPGLSEISAVVESVRISNFLRLTFNQPGAAG